MHELAMHTVLFVSEAEPSPASALPSFAHPSFSATRADQPPALTSRYGVTVPDFDRVVEFGARETLPRSRSALAVTTADCTRSCVVVGEWTTVFDAPCAFFLYVLMKAAPGLPRAEFISRWTTEFVHIVRRTPGQVAYGRLIVDSIETAKLARDLQFEQPDFDAMVLGGFGSAAELETAVTWANTDQTHAAAVQQLFAPDFRTILVAPRDVAAPRDLAEDISLSTRLQ